MNNNKNVVGGSLQRARDLVSTLESGKEEEADRLLDELARLRETGLYRELGKLTRNLHDTLNGFHLDSNLEEIARLEIPDAKQRLNYVIDMTDQAAHTTLNAVETSLPPVEQISREAARLRIALDAAAIPDSGLSAQVADFLHDTEKVTVQLQQSFSEILTAQSYQDLTGQVIRKVIQFVQDLEVNLVELVRVSGQAPAPDARKPGAGEVAGPSVPGVSDKGRAESQEDVDTLLSSLGF